MDISTEMTVHLQKRRDRYINLIEFDEFLKYITVFNSNFIPFNQIDLNQTIAYEGQSLV